MMVTVTRHLPLGFGVFFWLFIEGFLAAIRAEKIRLTSIFGLAGSGLGINFHPANGVFYQESHLLSNSK